MPSFLHRSTFWIPACVYAVLLVSGLWQGLAEASHSQYASPIQLFGSFMNGTVRLLFPVGVALVSGSRLASELTHRHIANTRTRTGIRTALGRRLLRVPLQVGAAFAVLGLVNAVVALWLLPAIWPDTLDPAGYDLGSAAAVHATDVSVAPLSGFANGNLVVFTALAALWLGAHAAVFALTTMLAVLLLTHPLVALLVPFMLYVVESVVFQLLDLPGASYLISAVYPTGLQNYSLWSAVLPFVVLAAAAIATATVIVSRAPSNPRLS
ncbi:MAG: hypothetical protein QM677_02915 [Microbacterium sp.]